ncbi:unnamed protein product [Brassica oleracea]
MVVVLENSGFSSLGGRSYRASFWEKNFIGKKKRLGYFVTGVIGKCCRFYFLVLKL